ncbi:MAG: hypothetical protein A2033_02890 [Bacteroidetes bacterium GWA2_31_9]|nr:MAG: hypothetical protein A2033_02890 [Bacteroidetes bacterium GWA2_31_9]
MKLEELVIYQTSNELADKIWKLIVQWDSFSKDTLGKELIMATDMVATNIAVGFGRYSKYDTKVYAYYSRGALFAAKSWLTKAHSRGLVNFDDLEMLIGEIDILETKLNNYIKSIGRGRTNNSGGGSYNKYQPHQSDSDMPNFDVQD